MGHSSCCVVNCKNNGKNSNCTFYSFPAAKHKQEQRRKWIAAIKRVNPDGSPWTPKKWDTICSAHFIGNKKAEEELSPSYVPTIFPDVYNAKKISESSVRRFNRIMKKRKFDASLVRKINTQIIVKEEKCEDTGMHVIYLPTYNFDKQVVEQHNEEVASGNQIFDKEIQVDFPRQSSNNDNTFVCNRYIYIDRNDAEIQTEVSLHLSTRKSCENKQTNTLLRYSYF